MSKTSTSLSRADDSAVLAGQLEAQYQRAIGGLMEVVKFGAMMLALRSALESRGFSGQGVKGDGLKGWLEAHCPNVNRQTAYRFMMIAEGVRDEMQIGRKVDFAALLNSEADALDPKLAKKRREIEAFLAGKSQRQLLFHFANPDPKPKGGARVAGEDPRTTEEKEAEALEALRASHQKFLGQILFYADNGEHYWKRLSRDEILAFQGALEHTTDLVKKHLSQLRVLKG